MKRLTVDTDLSFCDIAQCDSIPGGSFCEDGRCDQRRCYEKLREYERSDLEPETLQKAQGLLKELKDARQTVELMDACGKRVCSSEEHWGCPYGNEGMTDCAVLLEAAYEDTIEKLLGYRTKAFRCPYGEYNDNVITTVRDMGYEVWQWDIDTIDWKEERSAQTILDTVIPKLHPGCVILCHNNGYKIKEYLPTLIETAQEQVYEFVTVSELRLEGDTIIDVNGTQKAA